ncbi:hypothetical protein ACOMHN_037074 [Nucella lapillus]
MEMSQKTWQFEAASVHDRSAFDYIVGFKALMLEGSCSSAASTDKEEAAVPWGEWTAFGPCTSTCGRSKAKRTRTCNRDSDTCSNTCLGPYEDYKTCFAYPCCSVRDNGWNEWSGYRECTKDCNVGKRYRERKCKGGVTECSYLCEGPRSEYQPCNVHDCCFTFSHGWSDWAEQGCSKTSGGGTMVRPRSCRSSSPPCRAVEVMCLGESMDTKSCNGQACCANASDCKLTRGLPPFFLPRAGSPRVDGMDDFGRPESDTEMQGDRNTLCPVVSRTICTQLPDSKLLCGLGKQRHGGNSGTGEQWHGETAARGKQRHGETAARGNSGMGKQKLGGTVAQGNSSTGE